MSFIQEAFNKVCTEAKQAETWYVVLMTSAPFYIGPEEGGTWGRDTIVEAYQAFQTEEGAEAAAEAVRKLAEEMTAEERTAYGKQCLAEMEWLDARGLDADYLRESDGPEEYYVMVTQGLPENSYGCRHYE
jgi:hypothetical protein